MIFKDKSITIKIEGEKRDLFKKLCEKNKSGVSREIYKFIDTYIAKNKSKKG